MALSSALASVPNRKAAITSADMFSHILAKTALFRLATSGEPSKVMEQKTRDTIRVEKAKKKTYNTGDSLVVTDPTTSPALRGLYSGERTGPSVFHELWSYVAVCSRSKTYNGIPPDVVQWPRSPP